MEAVVLAGGLGTRLQSVVKKLPKSMALINGRPFIAYLLDYLYHQEVEHVVMAVGYKHDLIMDFVGYEYRGMKISYSLEEEPLGTGGAIRLAMGNVKKEEVMVLNGDTMFLVSFQELQTAQKELQADLMLAIKKVKDVSRYGAVKYDKETLRVEGFEEKGHHHGAGFINGGVYFTTKSFLLSHIPEGKVSFEKEVLEKLAAHKTFGGINFSDYFLDIGIPEDYDKAKTEFRNLELG